MVVLFWGTIGCSDGLGGKHQHAAVMFPGEASISPPTDLRKHDHSVVMTAFLHLKLSHTPVTHVMY